jgi:hypothetical protein
MTLKEAHSQLMTAFYKTRLTKDFYVDANDMAALLHHPDLLALIYEKPISALKKVEEKNICDCNKRREDLENK